MIWALNYFKILKCLGCDEIHFMETEVFSEDVPMDPDEKYGPQIIAVYPPRLARKVPDWFKQLDSEIKSILLETYNALHNGSRRLAAMGGRAVLERVMLTKIEDQHTFKKNVEEFITLGYMQESLKEPLLNALDIGSASIHRGYAPDETTLSSLFEIIESIIHATCIVPDTAESVKKATPKRKK